jgi:galactitol-specific phosphotransferase system IIB component
MKNVLYLLAFLLISCNKQEKKNVENLTKENNIVLLEKDLDKLLSCDKFDIRSDYYQIPDYGCTYDSLTNKLGNANVIIIPKSSRFMTNKVEEECSDDIDCLNKVYVDISKLSIEEFKNNFDAVVFIINKEYLKNTPQLDQPFNPQMPYVINTYILKDNLWKEGAKYTVKNDDDLSKKRDWENKIIKDAITSANLNEVEGKLQTNEINKKWFGNYIAELSYGEIEGMNSSLTIQIKITKDSIIAKGEGYQMAFKDLLSAKENDNVLILNQLKNLDGYDTGSTMKPEFTLIEENGKYYVKSEWIDSEVITPQKKLGFEIVKQ